MNSNPPENLKDLIESYMNASSEERANYKNQIKEYTLNPTNDKKDSINKIFNNASAQYRFGF